MAYLYFSSIVYDITKRATFLSIQRWIEEVRRYTTSNVALILVGNKCDLEEEREVDFSEAEAMSECIPEILFVMETSAKDNTNIENIFKSLAAELKVHLFGNLISHGLCTDHFCILIQQRHGSSNADEDIDPPGITLTEGQPVVDNCACKFL